MLETQSIRAGYGTINVLWDVSINVPSAKTVGIVGPNGAGKTTLLRAIMGMVPVSCGEVLLNGAKVTGTTVWSMVGRGIALVPEGRMVFPDMSVRDNLMAGAFRRSRAQAKRSLENVFELLPRLRDRQSQLAGSLSGGEAQMLAIARGLMQDPKVMLIDEPSLGLAPIMVDEIFRIIERLKFERRTIVLVEQNTARTHAIADNICVMRAGKIVTTATPQAMTLAALQRLYFSSSTSE